MPTKITFARYCSKLLQLGFEPTTFHLASGRHTTTPNKPRLLGIRGFTKDEVGKLGKRRRKKMDKYPYGID